MFLLPASAQRSDFSLCWLNPDWQRSPYSLSHLWKLLPVQLKPQPLLPPVPRSPSALLPPEPSALLLPPLMLFVSLLHLPSGSLHFSLRWSGYRLQPLSLQPLTGYRNPQSGNVFSRWYSPGSAAAPYIRSAFPPSRLYHSEAAPYKRQPPFWSADILPASSGHNHKYH